MVTIDEQREGNIMPLPLIYSDRRVTDEKTNQKFHKEVSKCSDKKPGWTQTLLLNATRDVLFSVLDVIFQLCEEQVDPLFPSLF